MKTQTDKIDGRTYAARQTKWQRKIEKQWVENNNSVNRPTSNTRDQSNETRAVLRWNGQHWIDGNGIIPLLQNPDGSPKWENPTDVIQRGDWCGKPIVASHLSNSESNTAQH